MARLPQFSPITPIAPTAAMIEASRKANPFATALTGMGSLFGVASQYGKDVNAVNTNNAIAQAMQTNDLGELQNMRGTLGQNSNVDAAKIAAAINEQSKALGAERTLANAQTDFDNREATRDWMQNNPMAMRAAFNGQMPMNLPVDPTAVFNAVGQGIGFNQGQQRIDETKRSNLAGESNAEGRLQNERDRTRIMQGDQNISEAQFRYNTQNGTLSTYYDPATGQMITQQSPSGGDYLDNIRGNTGGSGKGYVGRSGDNAGANSVGSTISNMNKNGASNILRELGHQNNDLLISMISIESGGKIDANSGKAVGLGQINPNYSAGMVAEYQKKGYKIEGDPLKDPRANIQLSAAVLDDYGKKFGGNKDAIAIAYNGGYYAGKTAYDRWQASGKKGNVRDYIPTSYPKDGKRVNYSAASRNEMFNHAVKFNDAYNEVTYSGGGNSNNNAGQPAPQTIPLNAADNSNSATNNAASAGMSALAALTGGRGLVNQPAVNSRAASGIPLNSAGVQPSAMRPIDASSYQTIVNNFNNKIASQNSVSSAERTPEREQVDQNALKTRIDGIKKNSSILPWRSGEQDALSAIRTWPTYDKADDGKKLQLLNLATEAQKAVGNDMYKIREYVDNKMFANNVTKSEQNTAQSKKDYDAAVLELTKKNPHLTLDDARNLINAPMRNKFYGGRTPKLDMTNNPFNK